MPLRMSFSRPFWEEHPQLLWVVVIAWDFFVERNETTSLKMLNQKKIFRFIYARWQQKGRTSQLTFLLFSNYFQMSPAARRKSRSYMRTELVGALIWLPGLMDLIQEYLYFFVCCVVPTLDTTGADGYFSTGFYCRENKSPYKRNSLEALWSDILSWLVAQSQFHTFWFLTEVSTTKGEKHLMWFGNGSKWGNYGNGIHWLQEVWKVQRREITRQ